MDGGDMEMENSAREDQKRVAFLQGPTQTGRVRGDNAKEEYMKDIATSNPWERRTTGLFANPLRALKTIILIPLVVVRLTCVIICLLLTLIFVTIGSKIAGLPTPSPRPTDLNPLPLPGIAWCFIMPAKYLMRGTLFFVGYHWVTWTGKPASKLEAPIVTPNHVSWVETFYLTCVLMCSGMSKYDNFKEAIVGDALKALQFVAVDRDDPESCALGAKAMDVRAKTPDFPQFLIFPEGEVNSGKYLLQFRAGPFKPGVPVQPVHLSYPFEKFCSGYDPILPLMPKDALLHILRAAFEFHNPLHVTWLDPYVPSEAEKKDAILYANNVRAYMSEKTGVPCREHTYDDMRMMLFAKKLQIADEHWAVIEMGKVRDALHFNFEDAKKILQRFVNVDTDKTGMVSRTQFLSALNLPRSPLTEKLFDLYDINGDGQINFREYVCAQALMRGINDGKRYEDEEAVVGSPLHPDSLDFAWSVLTGGVEGKTRIEYSDVKNVFERWGLPTGDGTMVRQLFDKAKGMGPDLDREAFDMFMQSTPEYMQLMRLGEKEHLGLEAAS